jgi:phosphohistidine swiveling domain-containing protein
MTWEILLKRDDVDLLTISVIDSVFFEHLKEVSKKKEDFFSVFHQKILTHYINIDVLELGRFLGNKYFNSVENVKKYYEEGKVFLTKVKREDHNSFKKFKEQFLKVCHIYSITSWWAIEAWQHDYEKIVLKLVKNKKDYKLISSLYHPWKKTVLNQIQDRLKGGESIQKLAIEYQFLRSWSVIWFREIDKEWIKNLKPPKDETVDFYSTKELIEILNPNVEEKKFIEMAPYMIFFKDFRDDLRREFNYYWSEFFEELAKNFEVEYDDLGYLTLQEMEQCVENGKFPEEVVEKRKKKGCVIILDKEIKVVEGVSEKYKKIIDQVEKRVEGIEISGTIAHKGKARGNVRIIQSYHDLKKFKQGEILIANTTHPNYLPAMQKSIAFITNEGGMISHAAIVAREMKKPCIVGTKTATKVFKNGDVVEVDADNGVVRRVE